MEWLEVRCPKCHKLLLRIFGLGCLLEVKCSRCDTLVAWPSLTSEIKESSNENRAKNLYQTQ